MARRPSSGHFPGNARVPAQRLADRTQNVRPRLFDRRRVAQHPAERVLQSPPLLTPPDIGDILDRAFEILQQPALIADRADIFPHPHQAAIRPDDLQLVIGNHILGPQGVEEGLPLRRVDIKLGRHVRQLLHQMLRRIVPVHPSQGAVGGDKTAIGRGLENPLNRVIEKRSRYVSSYSRVFSLRKPFPLLGIPALIGDPATGGRPTLAAKISKGTTPVPQRRSRGRPRPVAGVPD